MNKLGPARLIAKSDPNRDTIVATIRDRITTLPTGSVQLAEDETYLATDTQGYLAWGQVVRRPGGCVFGHPADVRLAGWAAVTGSDR